MANLLSEIVLDSLISNYDKKNETEWRKEDIDHRYQEKQWRMDDLLREREWRLEDIRVEKVHAKLSNEQRQADTRAEHLSAISEIAAELGGFALVSIINVNLPKNIDLNLLWVYGITSALTICCMILSIITCTNLMLATTRYCAHDLEHDVKRLQMYDLEYSYPFEDWWYRKCESDWQLGYLLFRAGVTLFLVELAVVSWVQYSLYTETSVSITFVAFIVLLFWKTRIWSKWRYLMRRPSFDDVPSEVSPLKDKFKRLSYGSTKSS